MWTKAKKKGRKENLSNLERTGSSDLVMRNHAVGVTCTVPYLYASSNIFLIWRHLADSVKPTMSSGEQILTKGNPDILANRAARAVLPAFGAPSRRMLDICT